MLELYYSPTSTNSQRVLLTLAEKGVAGWHANTVDISRQEHLAPAYLAINPAGLIPALIDNGSIITESMAICEYIDERFDGPPLMPKGAVARACVRALAARLGDSDAVRLLTFQQRMVPRLAKLDQAEFDAIVAAHPTRGAWYARMSRSGFPDEDVRDALGRLGDLIGQVERAIAESGGPWCFGETITLGDFMAVPIVERAIDLGYAQLVADRPHLSAWHWSLSERSSYRAVYPKAAA